MNADRLVVSTRPETQLDGRATDRHLEWQQVAAVEVLAVRSNRIDLTCFVRAVDQAFSAAAAAPSANHDYVALAHGPFALDPKELRPYVEDQVVPFVSKRLEHAGAYLQRLESDRLLGQRALLIRRQHRQHTTRSIGRTVARPGDVSV